MLTPGKIVPELEVPMLGGDSWRLANSAAQNFTMLIFYRGLHCPICKKQLKQFLEHRERFEELGVTTVAISMDSQKRASKAYENWELNGLTLLHDLPEATAREWGLYISEGFQESEPEVFSEPGLFLIRPTGELYAAYVQSVPFSRPPFDDLASGLEYIMKNDYPARGTLTK
ncbi:AhpC/TSA family protein [Parvularcula sp. ZS-1/3]|uniref:AhpC/TSA family protein n=1 Tax=Parvularcula mediterranea TaxID=2732508 RepID=A0A7Y3W3X8_9PROT|nr:peroxiredoxin-like family protein [Parvularcula mediterranea]NNU15200.1 AhpC/TSA family protein [Parvularcula mediterranea]